MLRTIAILVACCACAGTGSDRPPSQGACAALPTRPDGILLAGSGSNLALVHAVAERWRRSHTGAPVIIPDSIGTGGAVAALRDGAIDVGLGSRPLKTAEKEGGLVEVPLARVAMALMVHSSVGVRSLAFEDVLSMYAGGNHTWPGGRPIVPLLREPGDSGNAVIAKNFPALGPLLEQRAREGRFIVAYTDQEMRDMLLSIEGSVGFLDLGTRNLEHLDLQPVAIDGKLPTDPGYPLLKPLSLILPAHPRPEAVAFVDFARSSEVADILAEGGFLPPVEP